MNEFEQRMLAIAQDHKNIVTAAKDSNVSFIEYFGYSAVLGNAADPFAQAVTKQAYIPIQADSYFVLQFLSIAIQRTDLSIGSPANMVVQITDTGAGETLYSTPTVTTNCMGFSAHPFILTIPRLIPPNTNIKLELTSNEAISPTSPIRAFVLMAGTRVYTYSG